MALNITVLIDKHCLIPSVNNSAINPIKSTHLLNGIVDHTDTSIVKSFGRFMQNVRWKIVNKKDDIDNNVRIAV